MSRSNTIEGLKKMYSNNVVDLIMAKDLNDWEMAYAAIERLNIVVNALMAIDTADKVAEEDAEEMQMPF